jgi:hypothetical protein
MVRLTLVLFQLFIKNNKKKLRFCPSAFAYLIAIVPCIWLLEINHSSYLSLSSNQTRLSLTIPRRFEYRTSTILYPIDFYQDISDSKENKTEEFSRRKRSILTTEKQDLSLEKLLKTSQEFMLKVNQFFVHSMN